MIAASLLVALAFSAEDTAIDADRPHVGTGTHVVATGETQVELGGQLQHSSSIRTFGSPALIRIGVAGRVEVRIASDGLVGRSESGADAYGMSNAQLGAKIRLWGPPDEPLFSVMPMVSFGLANREKKLGAGATDATLTWLVGRPIDDRVRVEGNYGLGAIGDAGSHFLQHLITGAVVHQTLANMQTYVEAAWWSRQEPRGTPVGFIDYGVITTIRPRLLFDVGAFTGVTDAAPDWGLFSGLSFAFGRHDFDKQLRRGARAYRQQAKLPAQPH